MKEEALPLENGSGNRRFTGKMPEIGEFGWIWLATIFIFVLSAIFAPGTVRWTSITAMLPFAAILAIVAVGQTLIIQQRGLDMSAAGMMALGGFLTAKLLVSTDSMLISVPVSLLVVSVMGMLNGVLVARLNIAPIVATLAVNALLVGFIRTLSGGSPLSTKGPIEDLSHVTMGGLPLTVILALVFIVLVSIVIRSTVPGRRFVVVGSNPVAALAAGIQVNKYRIGAYAIGAACFGIAGVLYAGYVGSASPTAGKDYLLPGIAAVVVGGTPFTGGRGSVVASGVAAVFMTQLGQMVLALGAGYAVQLLVQAGVIVAAISLRRIPELFAYMKRKAA